MRDTRRVDDSILIIRDHLLSVCMDLVEGSPEEMDGIEEDFVDMVDLLIQSLSLTVTGTDSSEDNKSRIFNCTIQLTTPDLD